MPSLTYRVVRYVKMQVRGVWVDVYDIAQRHLDFHTACHDARELLKEAMWRADSFGEQRCPRLFGILRSRIRLRTRHQRRSPNPRRHRQYQNLCLNHHPLNLQMLDGPITLPDEKRTSSALN